VCSVCNRDLEDTASATQPAFLSYQMPLESFLGNRAGELVYCRATRIAEGDHVAPSAVPRGTVRDLRIGNHDPDEDVADFKTAARSRVSLLPG
jgi:hypothetical protein